MSWTAVAVVGAGDCDDEVAKVAFEVGKLLADAGVTVVCGGRGGVMEAACRGAKSANGLTVGILPGADPHDANEYVDVPICTGLGEARNVIVVRSATEAVIAIGGEYGTLSEIGFALKLGKRVIGLNTWQLAQASGSSEAIEAADTPEEAVRLATTVTRA